MDYDTARANWEADAQTRGVMMRQRGTHVWTYVHPKAVKDLFPTDAYPRKARKPKAPPAKVRELEQAVCSLWSILCPGDRERMRGVVQKAGVSVA